MSLKIEQEDRESGAVQKGSVIRHRAAIAADAVHQDDDAFA